MSPFINLSACPYSLGQPEIPCDFPALDFDGDGPQFLRIEHEDGAGQEGEVVAPGLDDQLAQQRPLLVPHVDPVSTAT